MKIIIIGASRGIGHQTVKAALAAGHSVTALARHPEALARTLEKAIAGHDAVICTLGLPTRLAVGPPLAKPSYVLSTGTENIIAAMQKAKVQRLICVTAIGAGDSVKQCTWAAKLALRYCLKWLFQQKDRQEKLIKNSGLKWTIIRPTALTNGKARGPLIGENLRSGLLTQVSRADVAATMVKILDQPDTSHKALVLSYPARLGDSIRWVSAYFGAG
jgi:uncharacterized protein YbjT (DUF2867 family)